MAKEIVHLRHSFGDVVYLTTDPDQLPHIVTMIIMVPGAIKYRCACGHSVVDCYEFQISSERNVLMAMNVTPQEQN